MRVFKRMLCLALAAALLLSGLGAMAEEQGVLRLPSAVSIIGEEAFSGLPAIQQVVLPGTVTEIRARAFAGSGLTEINLPSSIRFIDEDAFADSELAVVRATPGTYAYEWAVAHGYEVTFVPLSGTLSCGAESALTGDEVEWTAAAEGGTGEYAFRFALYLNGGLIAEQDGADPRFSATLEDAGSYSVRCRISDGDSEIELEGGEIEVTPAPLAIAGLSVDSERFLTAATHTWTVTAKGGTAPYRYSYSLTRDGEAIESRAFSADAAYSYTFFEPGDYVLTVRVRDHAGAETDETSFPFTVALSATSVTGLVRIYIDCGAKGNILRTNSNTGHFELQINNSDPEVSFDNHVFVNPVFSYESSSGNNTGGVVTVFDGETVPRVGCKLYTFEFTADAGKVGSLLYDLLRDTYLNTESESDNGYGYEYKVASGPFKTYKIKTSNCFTALASWCSWLGYGTLTNIVQSSSSYTDYIAWRMFDKYGSAWKYVGTY